MFTNKKANKKTKTNIHTEEGQKLKSFSEQYMCPRLYCRDICLTVYKAVCKKKVCKTVEATYGLFKNM